MSSESSRIKDENVKMRSKLAATKSTYQRFRSTATTGGNGNGNSGMQYSPDNGNGNRSRSRKRNSINEASREEIVRLLEVQLGVKPKVVFPHVRRKSEKQSGAGTGTGTSGGSANQHHFSSVQDQKQQQQETVRNLRNFDRKMQNGWKS